MNTRRWIAVLLLTMAWVAVGIRYLDSEEDPRITALFMIFCVVGLDVWGWIWLKKRRRLRRRLREAQTLHFTVDTLPDTRGRRVKKWHWPAAQPRNLPRSPSPEEIREVLIKTMFFGLMILILLVNLYSLFAAIWRSVMRQ